MSDDVTETTTAVPAVPVWEGQTDAMPYACPVCGSAGTGTFMADHVDAMHGDAVDAGEVALPVDPATPAAGDDDRQRVYLDAGGPPGWAPVDVVAEMLPIANPSRLAEPGFVADHLTHEQHVALRAHPDWEPEEGADGEGDPALAVTVAPGAPDPGAFQPPNNALQGLAVNEWEAEMLALAVNEGLLAAVNAAYQTGYHEGRNAGMAEVREAHDDALQQAIRDARPPDGP